MGCSKGEIQKEIGFLGKKAIFVQRKNISPFKEYSLVSPMRVQEGEGTLIWSEARRGSFSVNHSIHPYMMRLI